MYTWLTFDQIWPHRSDRRLHRRYGKLFFLWLVVSKGTIWHQFQSVLTFLPQCKSFEKFVDLGPVLTYISQTKHLTKLFLLEYRFCFLWSNNYKEQCDILLDIFRAFWYFYAHLYVAILKKKCAFIVYMVYSSVGIFADSLIGIVHWICLVQKWLSAKIPWGACSIKAACCFGYNHGISLVYWTHFVYWVTNTKWLK